MIAKKIFLSLFLLLSSTSLYGMGIFYKADISAQKAYKMQQNGAILLDIRTPGEYKQDHPKEAFLIPAFFEKDGERVFNHQFIDQVYELLKGDMDKELLLICRSGSRTKFAANILGREGFTQVYNIAHGFKTTQYKDDWSDLNLPIEK